MQCKITMEDFARAFGTTIDDIPDECRKLISQKDFRYTILEGPERDKVILEVLRRTESDKQVIGAQERQVIWNNGWAENLHEFINNGYDLKKLIPKFIRPKQIVRLNRNYILPVSPSFELDFFSVARIWLFKKYLRDVDSVYEFGCGTGFNLVQLAQLYPLKNLYGLDFAKSSKDLIKKISEVYQWKITGCVFDMVHPEESFQIDSNAAVFTIGSLEQLASKYEAFLQFLLKRSPAICVHVEPTIEFYDENNLIDYLAIKFHRKRGYTENYFTRLRELESQNKIEILKAKRLFFGSLFMEGYTYIVWRPKKEK